MPLNTFCSVLKGCQFLTTTKPKAKLLENSNKNKPGSVSEVIINRAHDSICLKIDRHHKWSPFFNDIKDLNKKCDYVIITKRNHNTYLIMIELKSKYINKVDIEKKFDSTACFIQYCDLVAQHFFKKSFLKNAIKKKVVFGHPIPLQKTTTQYNGQGYNTGSFIMINEPKINLKRLLR